MQGFFSLTGEILMDDISAAAENFSKIIGIKYHFVVSRSRKIRDIILDFQITDLFHLCGLHYLKDIQIPQDRKKTVVYIQNGQITDEMLKKSQYYKRNSSLGHDISSRIHELQFLEQYLDNENIIRIFTTKNSGTSSMINAEYIIESCLGIGKPLVYIFLNKRAHGDGVYCLVSFFVKDNVTYGGECLYWMLKEKISDKGTIELFRHKDFNPG